MTAPTWTIPPSPGGYVGVPASDEASQDAIFYGEDIYFDVSAPDETGQADYIVNAAGDWTSVTGLEALRQSLLRRLITAPGEWATKPDYGCGARQFVKARNSEAVRAELASRIKAQFAKDPRVHSVDLVTVAQLDDGSPGVKISIMVTPAGRLHTGAQLPVSVEIR